MGKNPTRLMIPYEKSIAFYPIFAKVTGSIQGALYLQQLVYWSDKGRREDGFIYKTKSEIEEETTLTIRQQDPIRKHLVHLKLLETKKVWANGVPTLHYKINMPMLQNVILECNKMSYSDKTKCNIPITKSTTENTDIEQLYRVEKSNDFSKIFSLN